MLERFRIGARLGAGFGGLILTAGLALGAAVLIGLHAQQSTARSAQASAERLEAVAAMERSQLQLVSSLRSAGLQTNSSETNKDLKDYEQALKALKAAEQAFAAQPLSAPEKQLLDGVAAMRAKAEPIAVEASKFAMAMAGEEAGKLLSSPEFTQLQARWAAQLRELAVLARQDAERRQQEIAADIGRHWTWLGGAMALVFAVAAVFAVALTRSVTRPLRRAAEVAQRVAEGDLSVRIDAHGRDEAADLLRSLQSMAGQLAQMVQAVREASDSIDTASREISSGNVDLSSRTEHQAASLQQTAVAVSELSSAVAQYSGHADQVSRLAAQSAEIADASGSTMQQVAGTMGGISDSSRKIAEIIGVIDGIAFQTNILALNAAVEAARAGEQGRGFAVVAGEVRALAQRVTTAAAEVRQLIGESVQRVEDGARLVSGLDETMRRLHDSVGQVRTLVVEISSASQAQSQRLQQVDGSVRSIDSATQQNAALVEQVAGAAQSLSGQTQRLTQLVHRFRVA